MRFCAFASPYDACRVQSGWWHLVYVCIYVCVCVCIGGTWCMYVCMYVYICMNRWYVYVWFLTFTCSREREREREEKQNVHVGQIHESLRCMLTTAKIFIHARKYIHTHKHMYMYIYIYIYIYTERACIELNSRILAMHARDSKDFHTCL
jgi:hypothetical protein